MEFLKCLKILGLKEGYTEAEIKKRYRSLAKKYHPDLYSHLSKEAQEQAEANMKDINEAHDTLEKNGFPYSSFTKTSKPGLNIERAYSEFTLRNKLINKIGKVIKDIDKILNENKNYKVLESYREKLDELVIDISHYRHGDVALKEYEIKFNELFEALLKDFKKDFFEVNYIDESDEIDLSFNGKSLSKFYEDLKKLIPLYGRYYKFNEKFEEALTYFRDHEYYSELKTRVESKVSFLREEAYKKQYKNVDYIIEAMKKLLSSLYLKYESFCNRLNKIINAYISLYGSDIIDNVQMFSSGFDFIDNIRYLLLLKKHFMENKSYNKEFFICESDLNKRMKLKDEFPDYFELLVSVQRKFILEYQKRLKNNMPVNKVKKLYFIFLEIITLIINYNLNLDDFLEFSNLELSNLEEVTELLKILFNRCRELANPHNVSSLRMNPSDFV